MNIDQSYAPPAPPIPPAAQLRNDPEYVAYLEQRIASLESRLPNTALLSSKFLTRSFAVLGHYMVAGILIYLVVLAIGLVISLAFGGIGALTSGL